MRLKSVREGLLLVVNVEGFFGGNFENFEVK